MAKVKETTEVKTSHKKVENEKLVAILSYFIVGIIWYFADENMKKSKLAKFHVKEALNLLIIGIVVNVVTGIIFTILTIVTIGFGLIIIIPLQMAIGLFFVIIWIMGMIYAANEEEKRVPVIGKFTDRYLNF